MFIYHDSNRCKTDLWSPVDNGPCAIENRAFSPYVKHSQELEDAVELILRNYEAGNFSFTLDFDDDISDEDVEWIQSEVERKLS